MVLSRTGRKMKIVWIHGWMDGWMDGWMMDGWMDGWMDGRTDGCIHAWKERNWHNKKKINSTSITDRAHYQR
jgi:hypothetical protein